MLSDAVPGGAGMDVASSMPQRAGTRVSGVFFFSPPPRPLLPVP